MASDQPRTVPTAGPAPVLRVVDLVKHYPGSRGRFGTNRSGEPIRAVDGVSFEIAQGETLGLVGESGCGKSTVARALVRLVEPSSGHAYFDGQDLFAMPPAELRRTRRDLQMIFQDPYASLNPRMSVDEVIAEGWQAHPDLVPVADRTERVCELLDRVGLPAAARHRYPHEFSGGQRQRIGIARALALSPRLLICDEPVSALDVSVQAQVVNLLKDIQDETGIAILFIAHDLAVVRHISDRVAVMYLGRMVETGTEDEIYGTPTHPYTQALLSSVPRPDVDHDRSRRIPLRGEIPSPASPPSGCRFRTRCWKAEARCAQEVPSLEAGAALGHPSACFFAEERRTDAAAHG